MKLLKEKKRIPTLIEVNGNQYALVHPSQWRGSSVPTQSSP